MRKSVRRILGQCIGISLATTVAVVGTIVVRHILETPQPLKSSLPGEALLYQWRRRSIFYKVLGEKTAPPLVILHAPGIGASAHEMQALLEPLAQSYHIYAPDLLGFGLSDKPGFAYSATLYSEFCQDFLRDIVHQPATLLASGLSCNYAISTAANVPELCASLILISPIAMHREQRPALLADLVEQPWLKTLLYPLLSTRLGFVLLQNRLKAPQQDFTDFYATTHQLGAEHAAMALLAGKLSGYVAQQFEMLQQPVLMIWGTQALENPHYLVCLRDTTQQRQARHVELIQGAGLAVHQEQPDSVITAIKRWQNETLHLLPEQAETRRQTIVAVLQTESSRQATSEPVLAPLSQGNATQANYSPEVAATSVAPITPAALSKADSVSETVLPESKSEPARSVLPVENSSQTGAPEQAETQISSPETDQTPLVKETASTPAGHQELSVQAYCVKCKQKREMRNPTRFTMKNGRAAARGTCPICGSGITRIGEIN
jgi:pimeloyl-ACP methyl ester carboxylesterase